MYRENKIINYLSSLTQHRHVHNGFKPPYKDDMVNELDIPIFRRFSISSITFVILYQSTQYIYKIRTNFETHKDSL